MQVKSTASLLAAAALVFAAAHDADGKYAMAAETVDAASGTLPQVSDWKNNPGLALVAGQRERLQSASAAPALTETPGTGAGASAQ